MQSLDNLLQIGRLEAARPAVREIRTLLAAARQSLADAGVESISAPTRFDAAYEAILQAALAALLAKGYRTTSARGGHHAIAIQALAHTIGLGHARIAELESLRKRRNANDYAGAPINALEARECRIAAERLLAEVERRAPR